MTVYTIAFFASVLVAGITEASWRRRKGNTYPRTTTLGALVVAVILISVSALRWNVGTDYPTYHALFRVYAAEVPHDLSLTNEPGIRILAWFSSQLGDSSQIMFASAAIITIGLIVSTIWRWSPAFAFSIAIYILYAGWAGSFNAVRQYLAVAILFAAHRLIIERKFVKWLLVVCLAFLFHVSAVVAILFYFIPTKKTSAKYQLVIIIVGVASMLSMGFILDTLVNVTGDVSQWQGNYASRSVNPLRVFTAFIPILLFWLFNSRKQIKDSQAWFYVNMMLVFSVTYLASISSAMVARFAIYPLPFVALGIAYTTSISNSKERILLRVALIVLFAIFFFIDITKTDALSNFTWIFEKS